VFSFLSQIFKIYLNLLELLLFCNVRHSGVWDNLRILLGLFLSQMHHELWKLKNLEKLRNLKHFFKARFSLALGSDYIRGSTNRDHMAW